jgi:hypothetical protein
MAGDPSFSVLQHFIAYGYSILGNTQINEALSKIDELLKLKLAQVKATQNYKDIQKQRDTGWYSMNEKESMREFLKYPIELLSDKKKYLKTLLEFEASEQAKKELRDQNTAYVQYIFETRATEEYMFQNLPARVEMLKRLDETQRFLKSKLASKIPSEKKQLLIQIIKEYSFPKELTDANKKPEYVRLEKMIQSINRFLHEVKNVYNNPSNLNTNTTRKLRNVPFVKNIEPPMEGGKRRKQRKTRRH